MKNILIVNVNWLGDVIFSSPIFTVLKKQYPEAKISCLAVPRVKSILDRIPGVDEVIVYDEEKEHWTPLGKLRLIWQLRKRKFDVAFILHGSYTRALLVFLAGIPKRIGYATKNRGSLLTNIVSNKKKKIHRSDYYMSIVEAAGIQMGNSQTVVSAIYSDIESARSLLKINGVGPDEPYILVHPGGNWNLKRWPVASWAKLIDCLLEENRRVIITGASSDEDFAFKLMGEVKHNPINLVGKTQLYQLLGLMKNASVVVSADSGPLHLANSVGSAVVGLFGPTDIEITGPRGGGEQINLRYDVGCNRSACYFLECPDNICMQSITVKDVCKAIQKIKHS